ncbi:MAG: shikimate dehydrogenase [Anaerolineae bacterium]|nr:shikimate dehydrogenase [Anaerolineae bacterium]
MNDLTGLIGWPLGHSVSPAMHNAAFATLGLDGRYDALPAAPEDVEQVVRSLPARGYRGVNVTIPHKQAVMPLMDDLSDAARAIGAVNTITVTQFSKLSPRSREEHNLENCVTRLQGDNTDWLGFLWPLDASGVELAGKSALLLGAGGSARAVVYALAIRSVGSLSIWNRSPQRAADLAQHAAALSPSLTIHQFTNSPLTIFGPPPDLIINTTPVGMWPNMDASPWPDELPFPPGALVYDLVYRPEQTLLLRQAAAAGCVMQGGLEMLVAQGAASFELWTGHKPPLDVMTSAARAALAA